MLFASSVPTATADKEGTGSEDETGLKNEAEDGQEEQDPTWTGSEAGSEDKTPCAQDLVDARAELQCIIDSEEQDNGSADSRR